MEMLGFYILLFGLQLVAPQDLPFIITTWSSKMPTNTAWDLLYNQGQDIVDSLVGGSRECDVNKQCGGTVGYGGSPSETGEVTLDAMVMDGRTHKVGSVGCLRRVKDAIGVAHAVLKHTDHTLLVGDLAKDFALQMGFQEEELNTTGSDNGHNSWISNNCQPNFWSNVIPDPTTSCGPYANGTVPPIQEQSPPRDPDRHPLKAGEEPSSHDTVSMAGIDINGDPASTCTTNGANHKIPGRVGDCPITGSGSYAAAGKGAAGATGDGDIMMRFLPAFHAVQLMGQGMTPQEAAETVVANMGAIYPFVNAAITTVNTNGSYGAACFGFGTFSYHVVSPSIGTPRDENVACLG